MGDAAPRTEAPVVSPFLSMIASDHKEPTTGLTTDGSSQTEAAEFVSLTSGVSSTICRKQKNLRDHYSASVISSR